MSKENKLGWAWAVIVITVTILAQLGVIGGAT